MSETREWWLYKSISDDPDTLTAVSVRDEDDEKYLSMVKVIEKSAYDSAKADYDAMCEKVEELSRGCISLMLHEHRMAELTERLKRAEEEVDRRNLIERLPPRPKCPDCGVESLTGNVHTDECFNTLELKEQLARAEAELLAVKTGKGIANPYLIKDQRIKTLEANVANRDVQLTRERECNKVLRELLQEWYDDNYKDGAELLTRTGKALAVEESKMLEMLAEGLYTGDA